MNRKLTLTAMLLIASVTVIFICLMEARKRSALREIKNMGGDVSVRSYFYDEFNFFKMGAPYRIIFSDKKIDKDICKRLNEALIDSWYPVDLCFINCTIDCKLELEVTSYSISNITVKNLQNESFVLVRRRIEDGKADNEFSKIWSKGSEQKSGKNGAKDANSK